MSEHTPGPWAKVNDQPNGRLTVESPDGIRCIADVVRTEDATLIAAAPDMLDALGSMRGAVIDDPACDSLMNTPAWDALEDAIAKAEGR